MKAETESRMADLEVVVKIAQQCLQKNPAVILGSGASVPHGLPSIEQLTRKLADFGSNRKLSLADNKRWQKFNRLLERERNLENVLQQCPLPRNLLGHVVKQIWRSVSSADLMVFENLALNASGLPLGRLFRHLFDSSHDTLSVITTNYDRLTEYAADQEGYYHDTGLWPGYLRRHQTGPKPRFMQERGGHLGRIRTVNIWKVHGCLSWFRKESGEIIGMPPSETIPTGCMPEIIMPGPGKYEHVLKEPILSVFTDAMVALKQARAYLCIGFGFNDMHIQSKLESNWTQGKASLVILAKELSPAAEQMLSKAADNDFLALEKEGGGTRARWRLHPEGVVLPNYDLWNLAEFLEQVT